MGRTIIIGDVHGCLDELERLMEEVDYRPDDELIFVGDYVAKGPDSEGVVQFAAAHKARGVRGNHDQRVIEWKQALDDQKPLPPLKPAHEEVVKQLSASSWAYLQSLPYWIELSPERLIVHAGLVPGIPLSRQQTRDLVTIRSVKADGTGSKRMDEGVPWATRWNGPQEIVFGHDAIRGLQQHPHALGLDTGCCYGRELTAYVLPERRIVQVRAKRVYSQPRGTDL